MMISDMQQERLNTQSLETIALGIIDFAHRAGAPVYCFSDFANVIETLNMHNADCIMVLREYGVIAAPIQRDTDPKTLGFWLTDSNCHLRNKAFLISADGSSITPISHSEAITLINLPQQAEVEYDMLAKWVAFA